MIDDDKERDQKYSLNYQKRAKVVERQEDNDRDKLIKVKRDRTRSSVDITNLSKTNESVSMSFMSEDYAQDFSEL